MNLHIGVCFFFPALTVFNPPSSFMAPWLYNNTCHLFQPRSSPCSLGSLVEYSICATSASDIAAGIKFAQERNICLVITSSGNKYRLPLHLSPFTASNPPTSFAMLITQSVSKNLFACSSLGKSTGKGALGIWTRRLDAVEPLLIYSSAAYTGPAIKLGAAIEAAHRVEDRLVTGIGPNAFALYSLWKTYQFSYKIFSSSSSSPEFSPIPFCFFSLAPSVRAPIFHYFFSFFGCAYFKFVIFFLWQVFFQQTTIVCPDIGRP